MWHRILFDDKVQTWFLERPCQVPSLKFGVHYQLTQINNDMAGFRNFDPLIIHKAFMDKYGRWHIVLNASDHKVFASFDLQNLNYQTFLEYKEYMGYRVQTFMWLNMHTYIVYNIYFNWQVETQPRSKKA
jgi:hypothetical protein